MRYLPVNIATFIAFLLSIALVEVAFAEDRPGDEFRHAAEEYEHEAVNAVEHAVDAEGEAIGRYMQLATIFEEMAGIKRHAASMADADR